MGKPRERRVRRWASLMGLRSCTGASRNMGPGRWGWGLGGLALLCGAATAALPPPAAAAVQEFKMKPTGGRTCKIGGGGCLDLMCMCRNQEDPAHLFSQVFFCQRDSPYSGLAQTLDDDQLFWFDFPVSLWRSRLPDFQPEVQNRTSSDKVLQQSDVCHQILDYLTNFSDIAIKMPEAKGIPQVEVFTLQPLQLGKSNTLVCSVTNVFPPSATITWEHQEQPAKLVAITTQIYPVQWLDFQIFSYLNVTPQEGDIYSCTVQTPRATFSSVGFWVPKDPIASELLENALTGLAFAVGILLMIVGFIFLAMTARFRSSD